MASKQPNGAKPAPISSHKAFPAIVALWFAALFGIGSFVLPAQLLGAVTGQETLGVTTKIVIALVAAIIGAALGMWIARKIKASQMVAPVRNRAPNLRPADAHPDAPARRPIFAMEELGEEKLAESVPEDDSEEPAPLRRRRSLSVTEESGRSEYLDFVPLPGQEHEKERAAFPDEDSANVLDFSDHPDMLPAEEPLNQVAEVEVVTEEMQAEEEAEPLELVAEEFEEPEALELSEPAFVKVEATEEPEAAAETPIAETNNIPVADRRVEELGIVELVERLAISIKQRKEAPISARAAFSESFFGAPAETPESTEELADEPLEFCPMPSALQSLMIDENDEHDEDDDDDEPFPALDLTKSLRPFGAPSEDKELAEEIQAEDEFVADLPEPAEFADVDEEVAEFEEAVTAKADDMDDTVVEGDGEDAEDDGYTSLLAMKSPFLPGQEPVRIEEDDEAGDEIQPMVVFPNADIILGQTPAFSNDESEDKLASEPADFGAPTAARPFDAPGANAPAAAPAPQKADPAETEKALRDALSTLRRMSGAA